MTLRSDDGSFSLTLQVGSDRTGSVCFIGVAAERGRNPLVVVESSIPHKGNTWEIRGDGIWANHVCESPFEHWSYGLEAFGLTLDDPRELLGRGFGIREPLGWELEFESSDEPQPLGKVPSELGGYRQYGIGHGIVLFKGRDVEIEGIAVRQHWWHDHSDASISLPTNGKPQEDDSTGAIALPLLSGVWWYTPGSEVTQWGYENLTI